MPDGDKGTEVNLPDGYTDLPAGKIAAIQTFLEMREPPPLRQVTTPAATTLRHVAAPDADWYLALFHKIGDEYLWFSRLVMPRDELETIINDPHEAIYVVEQGGSEEGLLELDFRTPGECEIAYLGLTAKLVGAGIGRWLMNRAIELAWAKPISRFWVHTCNLDHPNALEFYRRSGFTPYARKLEIGDDPRLSGLVPRAAAPQIPIL
jgi:GNAT superfamily N-acetyltransferase